MGTDVSKYTVIVLNRIDYYQLGHDDREIEEPSEMLRIVHVFDCLKCILTPRGSLTLQYLFRSVVRDFSVIVSFDVNLIDDGG